MFCPAQKPEQSPELTPEQEDAARLTVLRAAFPSSNARRQAARQLATPASNNLPYASPNHVSYNTIAAHWGNLDWEGVARYLFDVKRQMAPNVGKWVLRFVRGNSEVLSQSSRPNAMIEVATITRNELSHRYRGITAMDQTVKRGAPPATQLGFRVDLPISNPQRIHLHRGRISIEQLPQLDTFALYSGRIPLEGDHETVATRSKLVRPETFFGNEAFQLIRDVFAYGPAGMRGFDRAVNSEEGLPDLSTLLAPPRLIPSRQWAPLPDFAD